MTTVLPETYDAIVVGSGAAGGWVVKEMTERGLKVLMLEAGPALDPAKDFPDPTDDGGSRIQLLNRAKAVLGGQHVQGRSMSFGPVTKRYFVNDRQNPYSTAGGPFNWYRSRVVGGRLHLWGRNALRYSDHDLHAAREDGFGPDWPIDYTDLDPWYGKVETFLGVHGSAAHIEDFPDGEYAGPHPITKAEARVLATLAEKWPDRPATTARIVSHNPGRIPLPLVAAQKTGNLIQRPDAVVSHVIVDEATGKATGVAFRDRTSREAVEARAKVVVLAASTIESTRILLNSTSARHPAGLGGSSGVLGRYLTDKVMLFQAGPLDEIEGAERADTYDFGSQSGIYMPSFRNARGDHQAGFKRGYSLLGSVGRIEPGWFFMSIGEMLPRLENRVELDRSKRDAWGIPVARITCTHSDNERAMIADMKTSLADLAKVCGLPSDHLGKESLISRTVYKLVSRLVYTPEGALVPGSAIHEAGGAIMGADAKSSVLNRHNQVWDAPNVFVTDTAAFPCSPYQNPGLTIMALSARAGNHIADEMGKGAFN